jgi:phosphatidylglycerophosphate synthase
MRSSKDVVLFRLASAAHNWGFTPNMMTTIGLTLGVAGGALFAMHAVSFAFALSFLSIFCDVLDGTLARKFHLESKVGLVFDSVSDRITEAAIVLGALAAGTVQPIGMVAIAGSFCLLAFRAISHRRGTRTDYVLFGRTERLVFIFGGLLVPSVTVSSLFFVAAGGFGLVSSGQIAISSWTQHRK